MLLPQASSLMPIGLTKAYSPQELPTAEAEVPSLALVLSMYPQRKSYKKD
jgi:hypothetical protein